MKNLFINVLVFIVGVCAGFVTFGIGLATTPTLARHITEIVEK